jgi:hypothetical protein
VEIEQDEEDQPILRQLRENKRPRVVPVHTEHRNTIVPLPAASSRPLALPPASDTASIPPSFPSVAPATDADSTPRRPGLRNQGPHRMHYNPAALESASVLQHVKNYSLPKRK